MHYKFPEIRHVDDVREAIADRKEFFLTEKDKYIVAGYTVTLPDSFDIVEDDVMEVNGVVVPKGVVRREFRGMLFDLDGKLISRPLHKFHNINEREETQAHVLRMDMNPVVLEKLDGSMIHAFCTPDGVLRLGTKMGETDFSEMAKPFFEDHAYHDLAHWCIDNDMTPIFEFMSQKNKVVVDYGDEDMLTLLAIRHHHSGEYVPFK